MASISWSFNSRSSSNSSTISYRSQPYVKLAVTLSMLFTQVFASALPLSDNFGSNDFSSFRHHSGDGDELPRTTGKLILDLLNIAGLVLAGGLMAGLTLALMGLDMVNLKILETSGSDVERIRAAKVLKLLEKGRHWVLVVLLLGNVIVNESLPIFLSDFGSGITAVLSSTALIVIFGEIVPQSICARYGLAIGAACAPFVKFMMYAMAPVAWPTAKLLDWCLGHDEGTTYRKAELKTLVSLHSQIGTENLNDDEVTIIRAVLDLNDKTVRTVMTPIEDVFTLPADHILDDDNVSKLVQSGYSRVPIHEPGKSDAVLGMLLVKKLIAYDPEDAMPVSYFQLTPLPEASPDLTLLDCLNYFQQGRSHMLLVSTHPGEPEGALGVVTLEDVVEELIGEEIIDETDVFVDVHNKIKVRRNRKDGDKTNNLAPLISGIIERRRKLGGPGRTPLRSSYGTISAASRSNSISNNASAGVGLSTSAQPSAVDKVQIKRPTSPPLSSSLGQYSSTSPRNTDGFHPERSSYHDDSNPINGKRSQSDVEEPFIVEVGSQGKHKVQSKDIPSQILENKAGEEEAAAQEEGKKKASSGQDGERQPLLQKINPFS